MLHTRLLALKYMSDAYPGFVAEYALECDPFILHYPSDALNSNM